MDVIHSSPISSLLNVGVGGTEEPHEVRYLL